MLAAQMILELDIEVEAIFFETPFFSAHKAEHAAKTIGLPLTVIDLTDSHLHMLKAPRYGYGKNMNPCIDCHALMLRRAGQRMEATGADLVITGEVLGQRPMSQTKQSLMLVAKMSGYGDFIVRPLSAKLLAETKPEKEGKIDRERLLAIQGRGRKAQIEMAHRYGIADYAPPAGGCLLTDPNYSRRLRDLFEHRPDCTRRDIELLKYGRHFRIQGNCKAIVGRDQKDNRDIQSLITDDDAVLHVADSAGPTVLVPGGADDQALAIAAALCALYGGRPSETTSRISCKQGSREQYFHVHALSRDEAQQRLL
jgi:tRNA U34 2-thiouridine synthase MnmA/TrmU